MTLTPNSKSSEVLMEHEGEEAAYVMGGKVDLYLDDEVITLNNRYSVRKCKHIHKWENTYDDVVNIIFAITPPTF